MKLIRRRTFNRMKLRLGRLYGHDRTEQLADRLYMLIGRYGVVPESGAYAGEEEGEHQRWDEKDAVLITYGDMVSRPDCAPLKALKEFCDRRLRGAISVVHLLPFFPSSSDAGFSIIDYRAVDPALGSWDEIESLGRGYGLMVDLVLNHCSRKSPWFRDYVNGIAPHDSYFQEGDPEEDHREVFRPRPWKLFSDVETARGLRHVWNTFSEDQVDLNWKSPDVLFDFLDLLLTYVSRGARLIRLDAVAFLWKEPGTNCIHLPQTHEVVKLMRDVLLTVAPQTILLTETNVPHEENISYFGEGDEAHMIYQFALPPLLLHGLLRNDSTHLQKWARSLDDPPREATYLNFTASHDGIGVRALEDLVPAQEVPWLVEQVKARDGLVSVRSLPDGSEKPYELNITYRDALRDPENDDHSLRRFMCSQCLMMSLRGIPAVYFQSVVGASNWTDGPEREEGEDRDINRQRWQWQDLEEKLDDPEGSEAWILNIYTSMLRARAECPAFHPDATQQVLETGSELFGLVRRSLCGAYTVACFFNFTAGEIVIDPTLLADVLGTSDRCWDMLCALTPIEVDACRLGPYECAWIASR